MGTPTIFSFCVYAGTNHNLLYNCGTDAKYIKEIDQVIKSPNWNKLDSDKLLLSYDDNVRFYFQIGTDYMYVVISNKSFNGKIYDFINQLENFIVLKSIKNYSFYSKEFNEMVNNFINSQDKIGILQGQIAGINDVMSKAIDKTLQRGEDLDQLEHKSNELKKSTFEFENKAKLVKNVMRWKDLKLKIIGAGVIIFIISFVLLVLFA
jgi:hypothetical protein